MSKKKSFGTPVKRRRRRRRKRRRRRRRMRKEEVNITSHKQNQRKADRLDALGPRGDSSNRFGLV
jgi:hypothetical protein